MKVHYLYSHQRQDTGEVFYIGMGSYQTKKIETSFSMPDPEKKYKRAYKKTSGCRNEHWWNLVNKIDFDYDVHILMESNSRKFIANKEKEYIAKYGRAFEGGTLCNWGEGGEGNTASVGKHNPMARAVYQFDLEGNFMREWNCMADVKRALNISPHHISSCCAGNYKTSGGFIWRYKYDDNGNLNPKNLQVDLEKLFVQGNSKAIYQFSIDGEFIREWSSMAEVERSLKIGHGEVSSCCNLKKKSAGGYIWTFKYDQETGKENPKTINIYLYQNGKRKQIEQYSLSGEFIKLWRGGAKEIEKELQISEKAVKKNCQGTSKSSHGFKWKYVKEYYG